MVQAWEYVFSQITIAKAPKASCKNLLLKFPTIRTEVLKGENMTNKEKGNYG